jgi:Sir2 family
MKKHYEAPRPQQPEGTDFDGGCEVVQLHGDLETLRCTVCATQFTWTDNETEIFVEGCAPKCVKCDSKSEARQATGKRGLSVGSLRPNIVLYGEEHPSNSLVNPFPAFDASCQPEVLIIMGTSLKVYGLQKIIREFAKAIHAQKNGKGRVIFVNRTRPAESIWENILDSYISMDCDDWIADLRTRRPDLWLRQGEIDLKVVKPKPKATKRKRKTEEAQAEADVRPPKKVKITVEISAQTSDSASYINATQTQKLKPDNQLPSTPRHQKGKPPPYRIWEDDAGTPRRRIQQTPRRPPFSPITPGFSPMTPRGMTPSPLNTSIIADRIPETINVDGGQDEDISIPTVKGGLKSEAKSDELALSETPSKGPVGRRKVIVMAEGKENCQPTGVKDFSSRLPRPVRQMLWGIDA